MAQTAQIIQFNRHRMEQEESPPDTGYIKLFRSLQDSAFSDRPEFMSAWMHMLMLATHKPYTTMTGNKPLQLQVGQFVSGRDKLAGRVGVSAQTMRTIISFFESEGMITRTPCYKGTVFTVVNYGHFQGGKSEKINQQPTSTINQQPTSTKASKYVGCSESDNLQSTSSQPPQSTTIQEDNSIPNGIDTYASSDDPSEFEWIWKNRPRREGSDPKRKAFQACNARIKQGATWKELASGMKRYGRFCETKGILNTEFVKTMAAFFGPDEHYKNEWVVNTNSPAGAKTGAGPDWNDTDWAEDLEGL